MVPTCKLGRRPRPRTFLPRHDRRADEILVGRRDVPDEGHARRRGRRDAAPRRVAVRHTGGPEGRRGGAHSPAPKEVALETGVVAGRVRAVPPDHTPVIPPRPATGVAVPPQAADAVDREVGATTPNAAPPPQDRPRPQGDGGRDMVVGGHPTVSARPQVVVEPMGRVAAVGLVVALKRPRPAHAAGVPVPTAGVGRPDARKGDRRFPTGRPAKTVETPVDTGVAEGEGGSPPPLAAPVAGRGRHARPARRLATVRQVAPQGRVARDVDAGGGRPGVGHATRPPTLVVPEGHNAAHALPTDETGRVPVVVKADLPGVALGGHSRLRGGTPAFPPATYFAR